MLFGTSSEVTTISKCPASSVAFRERSVYSRELEVARLVARRFSNKAIGKELGMATRTASTHLSNIFQKLGVSNRGELADLIRDKGVLDD